MTGEFLLVAFIGLIIQIVVLRQMAMIIARTTVLQADKIIAEMRALRRGDVEVEG